MIPASPCSGPNNDTHYVAEMSDLDEVHVSCISDMNKIHRDGCRRDVIVMLFVLALFALLWAAEKRESQQLTEIRTLNQCVKTLQTAAKLNVESVEIEAFCFEKMFKHVCKIDDEITAIKSETDYLTEVATWQQRQLTSIYDLCFDVMRTIACVSQRVTTIEKRPQVLYTLRHTRCGYFLVKSKTP